MNARRLAEIHRRLAELHAELAAAYEEDVAPANDSTPPSPARPPKPARPVYRPPANVTELDRERADKVLRQRGFHVAPRAKR